MTAILLLAFALGAPASASTPTPVATPAPSPDPWAQVRFLEGDWVGTAEGEPGIGTVHRSYQFIMGYRFLHERNVSAYAPKAAEHRR